MLPCFKKTLFPLQKPLCFYSTTVETNKLFYNLRLMGPLTRIATEHLQFKEPTPIQKQVIPIALQKKHIIASAETGTGKTLAYLFPIVQQFYIRSKKLDNTSSKPSILIITPTKELAVQVSKDLQQVVSLMKKEKTLDVDKNETSLQHFSLHATTVYGTTNEKRYDHLYEQDCLIATPGKLIDLIKNNEKYHDLLANVKHFVMDECDKILSMGFLADVLDLFTYLPKPSRKDKDQMQVMMFSATVPTSLLDLMKRFAPQHKLIQLNSKMSVAQSIKHIQYRVSSIHKKISLLLYLLKRRASLKNRKVLVFVRTKQRAETIAKLLTDKKYRAVAVHKDKSQTSRFNAVERFKKNLEEEDAIQVLVATNVLARGIDVSDLDYVINYDIPSTPEDYVHRVGRTGRAGREGMAISFVSLSPIILKVGERPVELNDVHFMSGIEKFLEERVESRKVPGPWQDEEAIEMEKNNTVETNLESKKLALEILRKKKEQQEKEWMHSNRQGKKRPISTKFIQTFDKVKELMESPMDAKANPLLTSIAPSLRNFKEGRYEDVIKEFEKKRLQKRSDLMKRFFRNKKL